LRGDISYSKVRCGFPAEIKKQEGRGPEVRIEDPGLCLRYASRTVTGVKAAPSPEWLIRRLESHGFRTSVNIADITNYVLLETGQPMHAFDLDNLAGPQIVVRKAGAEYKFRTLDNEERTLNGDMLLIWDAEKPVALAGIMGGLGTEITSSTINILLESAYFYPSSIRRTSKSSGFQLNRHTGLREGGQNNALGRQATATLLNREEGLSNNIYPEHLTVRHIQLPSKNKFSGTEIEETHAEQILPASDS
jgi:phenylalanyl-tRNA synthetase beta chain